MGSNWTASLAVGFLGLFGLFFMIHLSGYHTGFLQKAYVGSGVFVMLIAFGLAAVMWMALK